jgi:hypothetical protein
MIQNLFFLQIEPPLLLFATGKKQSKKAGNINHVCGFQ